jgi:hypothetical protein
VGEVRSAETSPQRLTRDGGRLGAPADGLPEIERRLLAADSFVLGRVAVGVTGRLHLNPRQGWGVVVVVLLGAGIRLGLPVTAALAFGQLAESPVTRWALIAVILGALDAVGMYRHREANPAVRYFSALLGTIGRHEDVADLVAFTRRWYRLPYAAGFALVVALLVLLASALTSPAGLADLPVGSLLLLTMLAYEVGEIAFFTVGFMTPFLAREARYAHDLFWLNPVQSTPIRHELHAWAAGVGFVGIGVTVYVVLAVVLVSPGSPLMLPVVAAFTVVGYVGTAIALVSLRRSIATIAGRIRDESIEVLERQIAAYRGRLDSLGPHESEELERLTGLYETVLAAPTSPRLSETLGHAARAMLAPTRTFLIAVSSEVYAERLFERLLP